MRFHRFDAVSTFSMVSNSLSIASIISTTSMVSIASTDVAVMVDPDVYVATLRDHLRRAWSVE